MIKSHDKYKQETQEPNTEKTIEKDLSVQPSG